jgi:hypothetical protein
VVLIMVIAMSMRIGGDCAHLLLLVAGFGCMDRSGLH